VIREVINRAWHFICKWSLDVFIATYVLGYLFFFTTQQLSYETHEYIWGMWNNFSYGSIGAFLSLYSRGNHEVRLKVKYPLIFSSIMFLWEIITFVTGYSINNKWGELALFLALISVLSYFAFREFRRYEKYFFPK
jgi:hypothetical protein